MLFLRIDPVKSPSQKRGKALLTKTARDFPDSGSGINQVAVADNMLKKDAHRSSATVAGHLAVLVRKLADGTAAPIWDLETVQGILSVVTSKCATLGGFWNGRTPSKRESPVTLPVSQ